MWVLPGVEQMGSCWEACLKQRVALLVAQGPAFLRVRSPQADFLPHSMGRRSQKAWLVWVATLTSPKSCKSALRRKAGGVWMLPTMATASS